MASTVTTDTHGVRVVTQIIPLNPQLVQCSSESKDCETKVPEAPYMTRMFLKGEPVALGTLQVLIGIIIAALGAVIWFTQIQYGEIPLGLGLAFIFSGSVTVGAHKGTYRPIIICTVALNIISALLAVSGICYFCFALAIKPNLRVCVTDLNNDDYRYYDCETTTHYLQNFLRGINAMLLILSVLEVCVCMTTVVFSCKACVQTSGTKMEMMAEQEKYSSQDALLASPVSYEP